MRLTNMVDYADRDNPELVMAATGMEAGMPLPKQHDRKGYALSQRDSELVLKVKEILDAAMRPKFQETEDGHFIAVIDEEVKTAAVEMCRTEKPPVDWRKALQVSNRVLAGEWFSLVHTAVETDYGQITMDSLTEAFADVPIFMLYLLRTSRGYNNIVLPEEYPDFYFKATTLAERRKALGLTNRFKYISLQELAAVKTVQAVCKDLDKPEEVSTFFPVPSTKVTNAFANISRQAVETRVVVGNGKNKTCVVTDEIKGITASFPEALEKTINLQSDGVVRLHDQVVGVLYASNFSGKMVKIPTKTYMDVIGLTAEDKAREKLKNDADALYQISVDVKGEKDFEKTRLFQYAAFEKRKGAVFVFSDIYMAHLMDKANGYPMYVPKSFFQLRDKDYYIARRICEHYRSNISKANATSISVKTLLGVSRIISIDDLADKGQASQRIIRPFTDALERIADTGELSWEFAYGSRSGKSGPLSDRDLDLVYRNYELFSSMMVRITWLNEPNYAGLKESKAKRIAEANEPQKRKRGRPRKQPKD